MCLFTAGAALLGMGTAGAPGQEARPGPENIYDVLSKALLPVGRVFAMDDDGQPGSHGMVLDAHLVAAEASGTAPGSADGTQGEVTGTGGAPTAWQGQVVHLALMTPDAVLVQAPIGGDVFTVCRDGDSLWATPGSKVQALLGAATEAADQPGKKKKNRKSDAAKLLGTLGVPVREQEMALLPILLEAADAGTATVGGVQCRVIDAQTMPQLSKSLRGWAARLWIAPDYGIKQITLTGPRWSGTVAIDKLAFPAELPEATFQPTGTDVMRLTAGQFLELIGRVGAKR